MEPLSTEVVFLLVGFGLFLFLFSFDEAFAVSFSSFAFGESRSLFYTLP